VIHKLDCKAVRKPWTTLFASNNAFAWPFDAEIKGGAVFFPTQGYHLTRRQFAAITEAARCTGEESFNLSVVEGVNLEFLQRDCWHWRLVRPSYEEYSKLTLPLENAIYSEAGTWGVIVSHECHATVGGSLEFIQAVNDAYGGFAADLKGLRAEWSGNPRGDWLAEVVRHL
jgi:hypothetical protein